MFVPFRNSDKEVVIRRAKALFELLLPCLALAGIVFSFLPSRSRPVPAYSQVNEQAATKSTTAQERPALQNAESKFVTTSSTSKNLITYTILGTF